MERHRQVFEDTRQSGNESASWGDDEYQRRNEHVSWRTDPPDRQKEVPHTSVPAMPVAMSVVQPCAPAHSTPFSFILRLRVGTGAKAVWRGGASDSSISTPGCRGCASHTFNSKPLLCELSEFELPEFDAKVLDTRGDIEVPVDPAPAEEPACGRCNAVPKNLTKI